MRERVVLVVDDESTVEDMINTLLTRHGYRTASFDDPGKALRFFKEHEEIIDLVVTDFKMPGIQGGELARRMADVNSEIPVVLITGYMGSVKDAGCTSNIKAVLEKPVRKELFIRTIEALLDRSLPDG